MARQAADLFAVTLPAQQRRYAPEQGWCLTLQAAALLGMEAEEEAATLAENALLLFDSVGKVRPNDIEPYRAMALAIRDHAPRSGVGSGSLIRFSGRSGRMVRRPQRAG
ncbi:hypothetical protein VY88_20955 [Azospirillum thiophilum]|uniref:Uncharacterized protein n=1 Tax=Azospirillum thiophilum TaxID=528244 RepID=A0AAC8W338_9PROT|nr:hypothetical protein AL072_25015 [Azospirillum thiophilum]KJR63898.1 hypothetical protein VY88_20955 [Azospirillum thiophilum]